MDEVVERGQPVPMFTQHASAATNIPVTTILAWERRYGIPRPRRDAHGRRVYTESDLRVLQRMRQRTAQGVSAARAAREVLEPRDEGAVATTLLAPALPTEVFGVYCLLCGDASGELLLQRTTSGVQRRFRLAPGAAAPRWCANSQPRCGRCGGNLYLEPSESRLLPSVAPTAERAAARGAA